MTETALRDDRWRVRRYVVPVPSQAAVARPWQLQSPVPAPPPYSGVRVAVWGIWPPQWTLQSAPMLVFPNWPVAFRAAWDRAQFAAVPPPSKQPTFPEINYQESEDNGEA